jgi:homoserine dehydrogenase
MKIGLIGYGCVGKGSYQILKEKYPSVIVDKVLVKDKTKERPSDLPITFDVEDIISNPEIDLVIEALDDAETAFIYALEILQQGKALVTANKKMVAENLPLLISTSREYGGRIFYEAAVCGSIPIIQNLNSYYRSEKIKSISGILNGSTNYILTLMYDEGISYKKALKEAQNKGFAESDPTLDVEGYDAANKLSILCYEAFGEYVAPDNITCSGITTITTATIELTKQENKKIKLIARGELQNGKLVTSVKPEIVAPGNPLYNIDNENNSVLIEGEYAGIQQLSGKGAGSLPTGLAVVGDVAKALSANKEPHVVTIHDL